MNLFVPSFYDTFIALIYLFNKMFSYISSGIYPNFLSWPTLTFATLDNENQCWEHKNVSYKQHLRYLIMEYFWVTIIKQTHLNKRKINVPLSYL